MLLDLSLIQNYRIRNTKKNDTASILLLLLFKYAYTREKKISQDQPDVNDDEKHVTVT